MYNDIYYIFCERSTTFYNNFIFVFRLLSSMNYYYQPIIYGNYSYYKIDNGLTRTTLCLFNILERKVVIALAEE